MSESSYCWMVAHKEDGHLVVPRSDGHSYEEPADLLFGSVEDAVAWRTDELDVYEQQEDDPNDPEETAYIRSWVLCRRTIEVVEPQPS